MMPTRNKTKIVCTIGPASDSPEVLERMVLAGMNVARLNFSHGDLGSHAATIKVIRETAAAVGRQVAIMGDLPGPKKRIGCLQEEPLWLRAGDSFTLSSEDIAGWRKERMPLPPEGRKVQVVPDPRHQRVISGAQSTGSGAGNQRVFWLLI